MNAINQINQLPWPLNKIINVCNELQVSGSTGASTSEIIAAAFVLNKMEHVPEGYTVVEAWERLGEWQPYIGLIQRKYKHLIWGH